MRQKLLTREISQFESLIMMMPISHTWVRLEKSVTHWSYFVLLKKDLDWFRTKIILKYLLPWSKNHNFWDRATKFLLQVDNTYNPNIPNLEVKFNRLGKKIFPLYLGHSFCPTLLAYRNSICTLSNFLLSYFDFCLLHFSVFWLWTDFEKQMSFNCFQQNNRGHYLV